MNGEEEMGLWIEKNVVNNNKTPINEKINKIKNILNS